MVLHRSDKNWQVSLCCEILARLNRRVALTDTTRGLHYAFRVIRWINFGRHTVPETELALLLGVRRIGGSQTVISVQSIKLLDPINSSG